MVCLLWFSRYGLLLWFFVMDPIRYGCCCYGFNLMIFVDMVFSLWSWFWFSVYGFLVMVFCLCFFVMAFSLWFSVMFFFSMVFLLWFSCLAAPLGRNGNRMPSLWLSVYGYSLWFSVMVICLWLFVMVFSLWFSVYGYSLWPLNQNPRGKRSEAPIHVADNHVDKPAEPRKRRKNHNKNHNEENHNGKTITKTIMKKTITEKP